MPLEEQALMELFHLKTVHLETDETRKTDLTEVETKVVAVNLFDKDD